MSRSGWSESAKTQENKGFCTVTSQVNTHRKVGFTMKNNKERTAVWLYPETMERLDGWLIQDNCKSRSEFIEKALCFYMGYLGTEDTSSYLSKALLSSMEGTLQKTENRVASNLFRLSVEISMMMHLLAATLEVTDEELHRLRGRCVAEVKKTKGKIRLDDAVEFQNGAEGSE
ncbi:MAG: hypothetical protein PHX26_13215 [Proteiniphilum sp.]|nr:hypothetical protein [Proteiniphilum sp.]